MKIIYVPILIIFSVIIAICLKMYDLPGIEINPDINPVHLISILTTLLVAIYISIIFEPNSKRSTSDKNLKIERLNNVIDAIASFQGQLSQGKAAIFLVNSFTKTIEMKVKLVIESMSNNGIKKDFSNRLREINNLLTNTPVNATKESEVMIENGQYMYSVSRASEINHQLEQLSNEIFKFQLEINSL